MSVTTTADEAKKDAIDNINSAIQNLQRIVVDNCWGHDEYRLEYAEKLQNAYFELIKLRNQLV